MRLSYRRLRLADRVLAHGEREVALISRCQPRNAEAEQARLEEALRQGEPKLPRWTYRRVVELSACREALQEVSVHLQGGQAVEQLYLERIEELLLETHLVEAVGTRQLRELACQRYCVLSIQDHVEAEALAESWLRLAVAPAGELILSDDEANPASLLRSMQRAVGRLRLPVRVELSERLTAAAATGERLILVARGRPLSENDVQRIVLHEVLGHALPRHAASREELGLFSVGSRWGNDEQEGYALFLEERSQLMDAARRLELARRHHAALAVREGADWVETARALLRLGAPVEVAASIASRVHRAGGLAREIVYLPALCRVRRAIAADPKVEEWLSRGRLSLEAIGTLRELREGSALKSASG